ncbi:hypothetical protein DK28_0208755 [Peptococcaceae bacterium SCADC1_2_3]|jgi:YgiT-type zinc finger domain-containing protein|nr:hypothetical protein DK28_0208755 [Peptococcaceae bacterium SCADC1_2_3]
MMIKGYNCYYCGGSTAPDEINYEACWGEQRILIQDAPVLRCERCHEIFLAPDVLDIIKKIAQEEPKIGEPELIIRMPVRSYQVYYT